MNDLINNKEGFPSKKTVKENYKISTVIDRVTNQTTAYPQNFYEINSEEDVGLWFFVKLEEEKKESFVNFLSALGKLGIGGERSLGFGHFTIKKLNLSNQNILLKKMIRSK
ncbi:MAG: RAMP superfamily CRISPR-associated protein [Candidatus Hydrogenedens sp.]